MDDKLGPKSSKKFVCQMCDYSTSKKSQYDRHLATDKHRNGYNGLQMDYNLGPKSSTAFICFCGRKYVHRQGLWKHQKICAIKNANSNLFDNICEKTDENEIKTLTNLVLDVVKQNQELTNKIIEISNCKNTTTNINNGVINSNNKTFNLNVFLNEECKDAMNIMDFVDSLKIQLSDLESVGKLGYIEGISNIIIKNLKALDVHKRPVHCSDSKREVMYVKDEDKWEKENEERKKLRKAIKYIAHKNSKLIPEFREKYPDCVKSNSKKSDQYNKLIIESMGGKGDNDLEKENKIIKKIAREVIIDK